MKKAISLLLVVALMVPILCIPVSAVEQSTVDYIVENVDVLAQAYELLNPESEEVFTGEYVERIMPLTIISTDLPGTYIDFNGDNGYMVVQDDSAVIAWEVSGDLEYLQELEATYYSVVDGFLYIENGDYIPYDADSVGTENSVQGSPYTGPGTLNDGKITNEYTYVTNRYPEFEFVDSEYLNAPFDCFNQYNLSVYYEVINGGMRSEGNCSLAAIFALLNYLGSTRQCSFPNKEETTTHYAVNDWFYSKYANKPSQYHIENEKELQKLYYTVRQYAIANHGYERSGFATIDVQTLIESVASAYSNSVNATLYAMGSFDACVVPAMERDTPAILNLSGSSVYGNHSVVVTGYRIYRKTTTILGINFYDYLYILRISDNHNTAARYFDLKDYGGICSYTTVEVNDG